MCTSEKVHDYGIMRWTPCRPSCDRSMTNCCMGRTAFAILTDVRIESAVLTVCWTHHSRTYVAREFRDVRGTSFYSFQSVSVLSKVCTISSGVWRQSPFGNVKLPYVNTTLSPMEAIWKGAAKMAGRCGKYGRSDFRRKVQDLLSPCVDLCARGRVIHRATRTRRRESRSMFARKAVVRAVSPECGKCS